jgi:cytoskeletal protein RodZ
LDSRSRRRWISFVIALLLLVIVLFIALEWQEFIHLRLQRFG